MPPQCTSRSGFFLHFNGLGRKSLFHASRGQAAWLGNQFSSHRPCGAFFLCSPVDGYCDHPPSASWLLSRYPPSNLTKPGLLLKHHLAGATEIRMLCVNIQVSSASTD